jgi:hypothetical protein
MSIITNIYDVIIIGGGLSGLYSAYTIKKMDPKSKILVLESNRRQYIGGRIGNSIFYGTSIVIGAGIGRQATDKLLIELLRDLGIDYKPFQVQINYSPIIKNPLDIQKYLQELRTKYNKYKTKPSITFKEFATAYLGEEIYKEFIVSSGYSDYENEDVYEVLYHYQMENNVSGWTGLSIHWDTLIEKLCNKIGYQNIKSSTKVDKITKLQKHKCLFKLETDKDVKYYANKVIIATRINTVQKLLPKFSIYKQIHGQPFLYVYAKFSKSSINIMKESVPKYTIVPGYLQKLIPMNPDKGVYMIAYSDNKNAVYLKNIINNNSDNKHFFEKQVERALNIVPGSIKIISITDYYWPIGTHYYEPLNITQYDNREQFIRHAQHPCDGLLVVGEAVSRKQGWTEGALESVHAVLDKSWLQENNC